MNKLDQLDELYCQKTLAELDKQKLIDSVYTPEIRAALADIEAEFTEKNTFLLEKIAVLEEDVRFEVIATGKTMKNDHITVQYKKGRVTWDSAGLEGYAVAHPEIYSFRKEGDPSTAITKK